MRARSRPRQRAPETSSPSTSTPAQLAFELNALADAANAIYQLHGERRAFARAREATARLLG